MIFEKIKVWEEKKKDQRKIVFANEKSWYAGRFQYVAHEETLTTHS